MKRILFTTTFLLGMLNPVLAQTKECIRKAGFGEVEICLPKINGYKECYLDADIKQIADATEVPINMVLGYYLNDDLYRKKDSLVSSVYDDFFKIYGTKQIKNYKADEAVLQNIQKALAGNFITKNWNSIKEEIDKTGIDVKIGVPVVIKSYELNKKSFTYVMLIKYEVEGVEPYTMVITMNGMLLSNRVVWMAYYLLYENKNTINLLEEKSNRILNQLLQVEK